MSNESAARSYDPLKGGGAGGGSPRETEGRALLEAARRMSEAQDHPEDAAAMKTAVRLNWRLWTIFQAELSEPTSQVPLELRQNMLNLCNFVDKRTVEILADPQPKLLDVLINVNRQIAAGLLTQPQGDPSGGPADGTPPPMAGGSLSV